MLGVNLYAYLYTDYSSVGSEDNESEDDDREPQSELMHLLSDEQRCGKSVL